MAPIESIAIHLFHVDDDDDDNNNGDNNVDNDEEHYECSKNNSHSKFIKLILAGDEFAVMKV